MLACSLLVLALSGCGGRDSADTSSAASPPPAAGETSADRAALSIRTQGNDVRVQVEIADSDSERERGLMGRVALPENAGMLFLFDTQTSGGFWMKDTLIPLSIAFFDGRGRILRILDMVPCRAEPCPVYDPGVAYTGALEVNRGAFRRWGVGQGDRVVLEG